MPRGAPSHGCLRAALHGNHPTLLTCEVGGYRAGKQQDCQRGSYLSWAGLARPGDGGLKCQGGDLPGARPRNQAHSEQGCQKVAPALVAAGWWERQGNGARWVRVRVQGQRERGGAPGPSPRMGLVSGVCFSAGWIQRVAGREPPLPRCRCSCRSPCLCRPISPLASSAPSGPGASCASNHASTAAGDCLGSPGNKRAVSGIGWSTTTCRAAAC